MGDGLLGGRHHRVVGGNDDDGDIRHLRTTGTHGGEGLVARRVEEGHLAAVLQRHAIGTDVLGDTTSLAGDDVGVADVVEQRGLTMIDVAHDRDDRGARHEIVLVVGLLADSLLHLGADILRGESELVGHEVDGLGVETLVDGDHDAHRHECGDDFRHRHIHHRGQFRYGHKLRQFQRLALLALGACLLVELLLGSVALLLAVFGTLLVLGLRGEACQGLLDLACYGLVIDLQRFVAASAVLLLALSALLVDAYALLLALSVFLLALLASLLLALLLRARVLVDGAEVEFAEHVELRLVEQLLLVLCLEGCAALCRGGLLLLVLLLGGLSLGCGLCLLALGGLGGFLLRLHGLGCGLGLLLVFLLSVLLLGRGLLGHLLVGSLLRLLLHGRLLGLRFCLVLGCCLLLCGLRLLLLGLLWLLGWSAFGFWSVFCPGLRLSWSRSILPSGV